MAKTTVKIEGLRELEAALGELPKSTGKSVLRRVLLKRAAPVRDAAQARAPKGETGKLKASAGASTKLSRRQKQLAGGGAKATSAGFRSDAKNGVEVYVGFKSSPASIVQEFGSSTQRPQAFMRPAWDATQGAVLEGLKDDLWNEIQKTAKRVAKRKAKLAAAGG